MSVVSTWKIWMICVSILLQFYFTVWVIRAVTLYICMTCECVHFLAQILSFSIVQIELISFLFQWYNAVTDENSQEKEKSYSLRTIFVWHVIFSFTAGFFFEEKIICINMKKKEFDIKKRLTLTIVISKL